MRTREDEKKAELQHNSLVRGLERALEGGEWQVVLVVCVGGMCGSVEEKAFMTNMELLGVVEGERDSIRKRHAALIDAFFIHSTLELR